MAFKLIETSHPTPLALMLWAKTFPGFVPLRFPSIKSRAPVCLGIQTLLCTKRCSLMSMQGLLTSFCISGHSGPAHQIFGGIRSWRGATGRILKHRSHALKLCQLADQNGPTARSLSPRTDQHFLFNWPLSGRPFCLVSQAPLVAK
jgi:hypothetical protein